MLGRLKMVNDTAKYTKIASGYMGQLVQWPEVITESKNFEECRAMHREALNKMMLACRKAGKNMPMPQAI